MTRLKFQNTLRENQCNLVLCKSSTAFVRKAASLFKKQLRLNKHPISAILALDETFGTALAIDLDVPQLWYTPVGVVDEEAYIDGMELETGMQVLIVLDEYGNSDDDNDLHDVVSTLLEYGIRAKDIYICCVLLWDESLLYETIKDINVYPLFICKQSHATTDVLNCHKEIKW